MRHVQVLMSAYNGEKYLAEQIDSILAQEGVEVSLLIRDDGSTDKTTDILKYYAKRNHNIIWYKGDNLGVQGSFFDLLARADLKAEYYAFSDQDDYWLPEKLFRAVQELQSEEEKKSQPLLYAGKVIYASEDLKHREKFSFTVPREPEFGNALVENICMGCTEVFNRRLLELVREHKPSSNILHDWWLYLSASCFGKVVFDQAAYILYRQHESNQIGMQNNWMERWKNRIHHFRKLRYTLSTQAQDFLNSYGTEYPDCELVLKMADYRSGIRTRLALIKEPGIYRQQKTDNLIYHILFLAGLL